MLVLVLFLPAELDGLEVREPALPSSAAILLTELLALSTLPPSRDPPVVDETLLSFAPPPVVD